MEAILLLLLLLLVISLTLWLVRRSARNSEDVARLTVARQQLEQRVTLLEQEVAVLKAGPSRPTEAEPTGPAAPMTSVPFTRCGNARLWSFSSRLPVRPAADSGLGP